MSRYRVQKMHYFRLGYLVRKQNTANNVVLLFENRRFTYFTYGTIRNYDLHDPIQQVPQHLTDDVSYAKPEKPITKNIFTKYSIAIGIILLVETVLIVELKACCTKVSNKIRSDYSYLTTLTLPSVSPPNPANRLLSLVLLFQHF